MAFDAVLPELTSIYRVGIGSVRKEQEERKNPPFRKSGKVPVDFHRCEEIMKQSKVCVDRGIVISSCRCFPLTIEINIFLQVLRAGNLQALTLPEKYNYKRYQYRQVVRKIENSGQIIYKKYKNKLQPLNMNL